MAKPKVIAIVGPTAAGKTALGIAIAKQVDGEVVSVDSRQVYVGMDIGTAKPEGEMTARDDILGAGAYMDVEGVPHWGIDLVMPDQDYSVAEFKQYAEARIKEIVVRGKTPILVGGTGLWMQAIVDNLTLTEVPPDPELRAELEAEHVDNLFHEYKRLDPEGAEVIDRHNKRRIIRALEVTKKSGKPFSEMQKKGTPKYDVLLIGVSVDREELNERINHRVDEMVANGLIDEVRRLKGQYGCDAPAMSGIGYRELCNPHDTLDEAVANIKMNSRRFAKRQMTWFKRDDRIQWVQSKNEAEALVSHFIDGRSS